MQTIRYNFRQNDSARALNEHFLGLSEPGVKQGMEVISEPGRKVKVMPGYLMTKEGVQIKEDAPILLDVPACAGYRIDYVVVSYLFEEKTNPNTATWSVISGDETSVLPPAPPSTLTENDYVVAEIYIDSLDIEIKNEKIKLYSRHTHRDIGWNNNDTGEYSLMGSNLSYDPVLGTVSITEGTAIINGLKTTIPASSVDVAAILSYFTAYKFTYDLNSGEYMVPPFDLPNNGVSYQVLISMLTPGIIPSDISGLTVVGTGQSLPTSVTYTSIAHMEVVHPSLDGVIRLDCPNLKSLTSILATSAKTGQIEISLRPIIPIFLTAGCGVSNLIATCEVSSLGVLTPPMPRDNFMLVGYLEGGYAGGVSLVKVGRRNHNLVYKGIPSSRGVIRIFHGLYHGDYTVSVIDIEPTEKYSNDGILDTIGSRSMTRNDEYTSVYHTGIGDINKVSDITLMVG